MIDYIFECAPSTISCIYHLLLNMDYSKDTIRCPWKLGDSIENSPHVHEPFRAIPKKIYDDVLDAIGNTPMIRINKLGKEEGIECELLAKCEFMNMGGSVKVFLSPRRIASVRGWSSTLRNGESSNPETPSLKLLPATQVSVSPSHPQSETTAASSLSPKRCPPKRPTSSRVWEPRSSAPPPKLLSTHLNRTSECL